MRSMLVSASHRSSTDDQARRPAIAFHVLDDASDGSG
jgi:hypothetical protein